MYRVKAEAGTKAIRAVAHTFVGTDRTDNLLQRSLDLFNRTGIINGMVAAVRVPIFKCQHPNPQQRICF